jgi:hypothetical protein
MALAARRHVDNQRHLLPPKELPMIGYVVLGTNDLARAASFYDELLAEMGVTRMTMVNRQR